MINVDGVIKIKKYTGIFTILLYLVLRVLLQDGLNYALDAR